MSLSQENRPPDSGLTKTEITEAFIQLIPYVGFPKVLNAINVAKEVPP